MLLRPATSWGRFGGAGLDADSGSECGEDRSEPARSFEPTPHRDGKQVKLGPAVSVDEDEDEDVVKELERVRRAAYEACLAEVVRHLDGFLARRPLAGFEDWIADLHPDNLQADRVSGEVSIDQRFYAKGGEHRRLWNSRVPPVRQVQPRSPDWSPASSLGGSSGARTPIFCRSAFSASSVGYPYYELAAPGAAHHAQAYFGGSYVLPPVQAYFGGSYVLPPVQAYFGGSYVLPPVGNPPAHLQPAPQVQRSPAPPPFAAVPAQQQPLRWQAHPRWAWSPSPARSARVVAPRTTSVSPLRTAGMPGRADSPLRTVGIVGGADSPLHTVGVPGVARRADSPLRTIGLRRGVSRGGSVVIRSSRPSACGGNGFVWPGSVKVSQTTAAAGGG